MSWYKAQIQTHTHIIDTSDFQCVILYQLDLKKNITYLKFYQRRNPNGDKNQKAKKSDTHSAKILIRSHVHKLIALHR